MTPRRKLEPLRLDCPGATATKPQPSAAQGVRHHGFDPTTTSEGLRHATQTQGPNTTRNLVVGAVLLTTLGVAAGYALAPGEHPASAVATPSSSPVPSSPVVENDGSDAAHPILPTIDARFVDTRGGWGWGDRCWVSIKAGKWGWAKAECDEGMGMNPPTPQPRASLLYNEGLIARAAGNVEEARRDFVLSLLLREHPDVRAALNSLPPTPTTTMSPPPIEVVIYDPRNPGQHPNVKQLVGTDKLSASEQKRALDLVFGAGRYLTDPNSCPTNLGNTIAAERALGQFTPNALQIASGSFTTPDSKQELYLIANGECFASHADNYGTMTLAVLGGFLGSVVIARANIEGGARLDGIFDLDSDGRNEILITSSYSGMGEADESTKLVRFDADKLVEIRAFPKTYLDNCLGIAEPKTKEFSVIRAVTRGGVAPEFKLEKRIEPCK